MPVYEMSLLTANQQNFISLLLMVSIKLKKRMLDDTLIQLLELLNTLTGKHNKYQLLLIIFKTLKHFT